jgi:enoyl-CoA hydratase/carnithine racemase
VNRYQVAKQNGSVWLHGASHKIDDEVDEIVTTLLEKSPRVLQRYKDAIYTSVEMPTTTARAHHRSIAMENDGEDPDVRAGVDAALDDRESD